MSDKRQVEAFQLTLARGIALRTGGTVVSSRHVLAIFDGEESSRPGDRDLWSLLVLEYVDHVGTHAVIPAIRVDVKKTEISGKQRVHVRHTRQELKEMGIPERLYPKPVDLQKIIESVKDDDSSLR